MLMCSLHSYVGRTLAAVVVLKETRPKIFVKLQWIQSTEFA